jgi:lipoprotein-releasing system permease protein
VAERAETRPFAPFEWMLASRYLRARRKEGFISVIAGFSFIGIMLGVATLIIVMSVMNGFRKELFDKILGLNGHVLVRPLARDFNDYADVAQRLKTVPACHPKSNTAHWKVSTAVVASRSVSASATR